MDEQRNKLEILWLLKFDLHFFRGCWITSRIGSLTFILPISSCARKVNFVDWPYKTFAVSIYICVYMCMHKRACACVDIWSPFCSIENPLNSLACTEGIQSHEKRYSYFSQLICLHKYLWSHIIYSSIVLFCWSLIPYSMIPSRETFYTVINGICITKTVFGSNRTSVMIKKAKGSMSRYI